MSWPSILESLFFAADEPLTLDRIAEVVQAEADTVKEEFEKWRDSLASDDSRGLHVIEVAGGFLFATKQETAEFIDRLLERRKKRSLSQAALETLAIIAYREPITRAEIEAVRGVNVDSMIHTLLQRRLIKIAGRKEIAGHPFMYRTTKNFLQHFGLRSLKELPGIDELSQALADAEEGVDEAAEGLEIESTDPAEDAVEESPQE